jgi:16S rRNA (guanine966-N2)-methyltransferase
MSRVGKSNPGSVRIIGGKWRRRRLVVASLPGLRPTPDRVRETLFNWLEPMIAGARCLDLFAGTGALGFEALSRGARSAIMVDSDRAAVATLAKLNDELGAGAELVCTDAAEFVQHAAIGAFDIVFVDPPYAQPVDSILENLIGRVAPSGRIYLERRRGDQWPEVAGLEWLQRGAAGDVGFGLAGLPC